MSATSEIKLEIQYGYYSEKQKNPASRCRPAV